MRNVTDASAECGGGPGRNDQALQHVRTWYQVRGKIKSHNTKRTQHTQYNTVGYHSRPVANVSKSNSAFWVVHGRQAPSINFILLELRGSPPSSSASSLRRGLLWASRAPARSSLNKVTAAMQNRTALIAPTTTHAMKSRICSPVMVLCNQMINDNKAGGNRRVISRG